MLPGTAICNIKITKGVIHRFEIKFMESHNKCWEWFSSNNWKGYGRFHVVYNGKRSLPHAHRISYIIFVGKIPVGMTVHHKCNNKRCVNPKHLSLLTEKENRELSGCWSAKNRRKTHCVHGHPLSGNNLYIYYRKHKEKTRKVRSCMECKRINLRRFRKNKK